MTNEKVTEETRCRICGRRLYNPKSVARGIGPRCWAALRRKEASTDTPFRNPNWALHGRGIKIEDAEARPACYGAFGSEECIIVGCRFQDSCEVEETQSFEKARRALNE